MAARPYPTTDLLAERAVIGGLLIDGDALSTLVSTLRPEHFSHPKTRAVYEAMLGVHVRGLDVDVVSVHGEMTDRGTWQSAGGMATLAACINDCPHSLRLPSYAKRVVEVWQTRVAQASQDEAGELRGALAL